MTVHDAGRHGPRDDLRAVFFDAGFTLLYPARPIVDLYVETARAVSESHCDQELRAAFASAWAAGTRGEGEDHRSSDDLELLRWHRFTHRIATAVPALLPHHAAWLDELKGKFDCGEGWRLAPGATALLERLRGAGLKVAIVSNWHGGLHAILQDLGVTRLVDFVVVSADVGYRKPHPEIFHVALRQSGVPAASVLHVGDTWDEDVLGAQAVGIVPVHLTRDGTREGSHRTIRDLSELAAIVDRR
jgi:putative hydrolase of the HAD superfamily